MLNNSDIISGNKKIKYLTVIFLIVACLIAYGRISGNSFVNFDDQIYITENSHIQSGINPGNIKWALGAVVCGNWHPLTVLSHTLDWTLFGANASYHHLINLLLHIGSVLFLFLFLNRATKNPWPSAFAAALLALHPLRAESVAWAAERKDVLSMFFGMASIYVYAFYAGNSKLSRYIFSLLLFAMALMSKPMMVTLPFLLMILDYWPLGRWQKAPVKSMSHQAIRLILEKVPFMLLTIASSIITMWAQNKDNAFSFMAHLSFPTRIANAVISYISYLGKIFWPVNLAVFYPYEFSFPLWKILISGLVLTVITIVVLCYIRKLPFLFAGWFWYLGTLVPVIGLIQVGDQAIADRYTYLPSIGIAIMLAWLISHLIKEDIYKKLLLPATIAGIAILAILTWKQCGYWKNSIELYSHTLETTKNNYIAHNNIGLALAEERRFDEAIANYNEAIRILPVYYSAYNNRGLAYDAAGQYQQAIESYNQAIRIRPDDFAAYVNRGNTYTSMEQYQSAIQDFNTAIRLQPGCIQAYSNIGNIYIKLGQYQSAIENFNTAIRQKPDIAYFYIWRGNVYFDLNQYQSAYNDFSKAIQLNPNSADAYSNRGAVYAKSGQYQLAINDFNKTISINPDYTKAYINRAAIYGMLNQYHDVIKNLSEVLRLKPDDAAMYYNRGFAYAKTGQYNSAIDDFNTAAYLKKDYVEAYKDRGILYLNQGDYKSGCRDIQKACELGNCTTLKVVKFRGYCR